MDSVEETRYPFNNVAEYFIGYVFNPQGIHILITWIVLIVSVGVIFSLWRKKPLIACVILYFSIQQYNNPAFTYGGVTLADGFGILVALAGGWNLFFNRIKVGAVPVGLFIFSFFCMVHSAFVWGLNDDFSAQAPILLRYVIIFRVLVVSLIFAWLQTSNEKSEIIASMLKWIVFFTSFACFVYLVAFVLLLSGVFPFGTFAGAGFSSTVAFGGVSIERGHLSKFMAPLFPFIFLYCYQNKSYKMLLLNLIVMIVNFSASGLSFLLIQVIVGFFLFRREYIKVIFSSVGIAIIAILASTFYLFFDAYSAIVDKIYTIVILGDESQGGGRSIGLFFEYLSRYPFGIGYSSSTFRTAPGLSEINMGVYAFLTQLSFFGVFFILCYLFVIFRCWHKYFLGTVEEKILLVGVVSAPFVFFNDILWMNPLLWLPLFILSQKKKIAF